MSLTPEQLTRIEQNRLRALQRRANRQVEGGISLPAVIVDPGNIPSTPVTFCDLSVVDMPACTLLGRLHPHPRDSMVVFKSEGHKYYINGEPAICSVTGLIHRFAQPFDADKVIARMRSGSRSRKGKRVFMQTCTHQHIPENRLQ